MSEQIQRNRDIQDFFSTKETRFFRLLKSTGKWKELYNQIESKASIIISISFVVFMYFIYCNMAFDKFINMIQQILQILIGASAGMLGFIISGLAIFTGTITNKLVKAINSDEKAIGLVGILFSFYFIGAIIGSSIFVYIIGYILILTDLFFDLRKFLILCLGMSYLFTFSILYSVSLLGTCIRLFLISYKYSQNNDE